MMVNNMKKHKRRKNEKTSNFKYSVELTGLFLILIGIIGFGFGPVGSLLKKFSIFLVGTWWMFLLIGLLVLGSYMLFKRKLPKFFSGKLIGLYVIFIVILVASHFGFIEHAKASKDIFKTTMDNYMERISTINGKTALFTSGSTSIEVGGGVVGATFSFLFSSLFGFSGTKVVEVVLLVFGLILLFDITFADVLEKLKAIFKKKENNKEESIVPNDVEINDYNAHLKNQEEKQKDDRIVITNVAELKTPLPKILENDTLDNINKKDDTPENTHYKLPPLSILTDPVTGGNTVSQNETRHYKDMLENVLKDFGVSAKVVKIHIGPAVTQYELTVPNGTKVSKITTVNKEIALAMSAKDVRIQAPIPGKNTIGIEIPNSAVNAVRIKEILLTKGDGKLNIALGKDIMGNPILADLSKMPHLLIAGSTGSGKSVCTNSIICSILMNYRPDEVKLVLVDPKKVELSNYNGIPHLLTPVVTDPKKASIALQKVVAEMERRYDEFSEKGVKNIEGYNDYVLKQNKKHPETPMKKMHYLVTIIDELADLMLVAAKDVEDSILRITQMARAAGIHLIVATQRPSTDVITGVVKANIPSRIAFAVASSIDSRTILDMSGAEKLLGKGDMLYLPMGENTPTRIQGCFISDEEIKKLIDYVSKQQAAKYDDGMNLDTPQIGTSSGSGSGHDEYDDPVYGEVVDFALATGKISASLIQRKFRLGYNRAARIIDLLEERGIIGPQNGSKPREVLVKLPDDNQ
ncbi:MAG: cell division protein FtsK [Bacilli bacterium]|nr:cell division protein FtsK [Bacilli bacterium]